MADVFISYSRVDRDFVSRLNASLTAAGRDVWVDWEDIPPSAEWRQEIHTAIREANAFIFVISPDSCSSPVCKEEIEQSILNHKRIIPVLFRPAPREALTKEMREYNWVYCRESDDYEGAISLIIQALDTDLEWVKSHTRLQVRAMEWDLHDRSPSFTLRGEDLATAEALVEHPHKEPRLTDLQIAYITFSRKIQTRNQRRLLLGVSLALVISLILGSLAFWQFQVADSREQARATQQAIAESERDRAELQAGLATSGRLAAESQMNLTGTFPDTAVTLALEALDNYPYTPQAERSLAEAVQRGRLLASFSNAKAAHLSADGNQIAIADTEGNLRIIDAANREERLMIPTASTILAVRWSPDGHRLLALEESGAATIYDASTGEALVRSFRTKARFLRHYTVEWSPDGSLLAQVESTQAGDYVSIWSARDGYDVAVLSSLNQTFADTQVTDLLSTGSDTIDGLSWSPDGGRIITAHPLFGCCGLVILWDALNSAVLQATATGPFGAVDWSSQGRIALAGWDVTGVDTFDPDSGELQLVDEDLVHVDNLSWSPDGRYLAYATEADDVLKVLDMDSGTPIIAYQGNFRDIFWSERETLLIYDPMNQTAWLIDARPDKALVELPGGKTAAWSPDGNQLLVIGEPDLYQIEYGQEALTPRKLAGKALPGLEFLPLGSEDSLYWQSDGSITVSSVWGTTERIPLEGAEKLPLPPLFDENFTVFSPDGSRAVVIADQFDPEDMTGVYTEQGEKLYALPIGAINNIAAAAWSADGSKLATSTGSLIQVWNTADGELLASLRGHTASVSSLSWSTDGARLVSSSAFLSVGASDRFIVGDRTVRIWDVESSQELYQMLVPPGVLASSALWSPDGKYLLTTDPDQDVTKIWRIWASLEDLKAYARQCCLARPLEEEERASFGLK